MNADRAFDELLEDFEQTVRGERTAQGDHAQQLTDFVSRAPEGYEADLCASLMATAFRVRVAKGESPWIDEYLSLHLWRYREEVCRALTTVLYNEYDGRVASKLGVLEFGNYRVTALAGFGGFAAVLKAQHKKDPDNVVAVKLAHRKPDSASVVLENEMRVLTAIQSKRVHGVPVVIQTNPSKAGTPLLVTNWVDGKTLDVWQSVPRQPSALLDVCRQIARIVTDLHHVGFVHGDLSPGNILIREHEHLPVVTLVDFGNSEHGFVANRLEVITGRYAAPELLLRTRPGSSTPTDIWSLGVIIYEILGKRHPFGQLPDDMTQQQLGEHFLRPPLGALEGYDALWKKLSKCFTANPEDRFQKVKTSQILEAIIMVEEDEDKIENRRSGSKAFGSFQGMADFAGQDEHHADAAIGSATMDRTSTIDNCGPNQHGGTRRPQSLARSPRSFKARLLVLLALFVLLAAVGWVILKSRSAWENDPQQPRVASTNFATTMTTAAITTEATTAPELASAYAKKLRMQFHLFQPVKFIIGSPGTEEGRNAAEDQRTVELWRPFCLSVCDVTRGNFATFVEKTGYQTDADKLNQNHPGSSFTWRDPGFEQTDAHPVVMVSWMDAIAFCDWLSKSDGRRYRLPLESEWEYACRGGAASYTPFNTGEKLGPDQANIGTDTFHPGGTTPVGHFKPNAFGLFDMHGNVFQWCYTAEPDRAFNRVMYPDQQTSLELNNKRVMRGGSWLLPAVDARSASRTSDGVQGFSRDRGFRIALEPLTK